jgi:hypothetical protein
MPAMPKSNEMVRMASIRMVPQALLVTSLPLEQVVAEAEKPLDSNPNETPAPPVRYASIEKP